MAAQPAASRQDETTTDEAHARGFAARDEFVAAMLDSLAEGIVACDAEGTLVLFNRATREFHGLPARPLPPEEWGAHYSLHHEDGVTPLEVDEIPLFRALRGEPVRDVGMVIAPTVGRARRLLATGRQIRAQDGTLLGAVVAMHDVTRRLEAEEALLVEHDAATAAANAQAHAGQLALLQQATVNLVSTDTPAQVLTQLSAATLRLTGAAAASVLLAGDPAPDDGQSVVVRVDEEHRLLVHPGPGWDVEDDALLAQLASVGQVALRSHRLREQLAEGRASRTRNELMAAISHDMQTPTATLVGLAQVLAERGTSLGDEDHAAITAAMVRQGGQLSHLVAQFMDYSRLEAGHTLPPGSDPVALGGLVRELAELGLTTEVHVTVEQDATVTGEGPRLRRLLRNLVDNAVSYGAAPITVTLGVDAHEAVLRVRDRGPGLGADPESLFVKFRRGEAPGADGTGLGLYISRALATAHSGSLTGADHPDGGAELTLRLPLAVTT